MSKCSGFSDYQITKKVSVTDIFRFKQYLRVTQKGLILQVWVWTTHQLCSRNPQTTLFWTAGLSKNNWQSIHVMNESEDPESRSTSAFTDKTCRRNKVKTSSDQTCSWCQSQLASWVERGEKRKLGWFFFFHSFLILKVINLGILSYTEVVNGPEVKSVRQIKTTNQWEAH